MSRGLMYTDDLMLATDALTFSPSRRTLDAIDDRMNKFMSRSKDIGTDFIRGVRDRYKEIRSGETVRKVLALKQRLNSIWETNAMRRLVSLNELQQAPEVMRPYIMAHPQIREMYHQGRCSGYAEVYVDQHPGKIGRDHYDFRRVTDEVYYREHGTGAVVLDKHYEYVAPDLEKLMNIMSKHVIIASWNTLEDHLKSGSNKDPVSQWNGLL